MVYLNSILLQNNKLPYCLKSVVEFFVTIQIQLGCCHSAYCREFWISQRIQKRGTQSAEAKIPHLKARLQYLIRYNWEDWGVGTSLKVHPSPAERRPGRQNQVALGMCSSASPSLSQLDATSYGRSCWSWTCYGGGVTLKMLSVHLIL